LSERLGIAPIGLRRRVAALLGRLGLPERLPQRLERAALLGSMTTDKKNKAARIHFALPASLGAMHRGTNWTVPVSPEAIRGAIGALD
jgi:3-dehydroquinate synthetase